MKTFIDTEFIEDGKTIELISIGMVKENGDEFYAISNEFDGSRANNWVKRNVLIHLPDPGDSLYKSKKQIAADILTFIGNDKPVFWAYFSGYDWIVLCQLYGAMSELPVRWPKYCRDIKQFADSLGNPKLPAKPEKDHHALEDAKWNLRTYNFLLELEKLQNS